MALPSVIQLSWASIGPEHVPEMFRSENLGGVVAKHSNTLGAPEQRTAFSKF